MQWPAHGATVRLASRHTTKIKEAVRNSVDVAAIAQAWLETHPADSDRATPKQARDWAQVHGRPDTKQLQAAIGVIYSEGYVLGRRAGLFMLGHAVGLKKAESPSWAGDARAAMVTDWSTWKPGNEAARALVDQPGKLADLMNGRMVLSGNIASTTLDRIGTVLAQSLSAGTRPTAKDLAGQLDLTVDDPQRALVIAQTEMSRSVSVAARDLYESSGVEQVEWLVAVGCEDCQDNADASPISIDDTFPSGDSEPPAHPNCMCSLAPYVVDTQGVNTDTTDSSGDNIDTGSYQPDEEGMIDYSQPLTNRRERAYYNSGGTKMSEVSKELTELLFGQPMHPTLRGGAAAKKSESTLVKFVPGPAEVERALSRLAILPNPNTGEGSSEDEKHVESPWPVIQAPLTDPNIWDNAELAIVQLADLVGTDPFLSRKNIIKHIESMGQAVTPYRSHALIFEIGGKNVIIDGHHRLMATWLLGQSEAPVWLAKE